MQRNGRGLDISVIDGYNEKTWQDILDIRKKSFDDAFLYEDEAEYFKEMLRDKSTIHLLLRKDNRSIGYLLAKKHNDAQKEIGDDDPKMKPDDYRLYIDTMSVIPEYRGDSCYLKMVLCLFFEAKKKGICKFSMHIRTENKLSQKIQLLFGKSITEKRDIKSWKYAGGEPYNYLEGTFTGSILFLRIKIFLFKKYKQIKYYFSIERKIEQIYTPLEVAEKEIWKRWNNPALKLKIKKILSDIPGILEKYPKTILFRFIATPDFEYVRAKKISQRLGLKLLYMELLDDKFCTRNGDKIGLGKLHFFHGKNTGDKNYLITKEKVFDFQAHENSQFNKIKTFSGESLVDLHHRLFKHYVSDTDKLDISSWTKNRGNSAEEVYPYYLLLFVCYGILLEAYDTDSDQELKFAKQVVLPAFKKVEKLVGVRPLIVRLYDRNEEGSIYWSCYPEFLKHKMNK